MNENENDVYFGLNEKRLSISIFKSQMLAVLESRTYGEYMRLFKMTYAII